MKVLTLGTFDLVHPGHVGLFTICRKLAGPNGQVIVGINTDEFVTSYKGTPPALTFTERAHLVLETGLVVLVIPNDGTDQADLITRTAPDLLVIGHDWALKDYYSQIGTTQEQLDSLGVTLCYVPRTGTWSSTDLRGRV